MGIITNHAVGPVDTGAISSPRRSEIIRESFDLRDHGSTDIPASSIRQIISSQKLLLYRIVA